MQNILKKPFLFILIFGILVFLTDKIFLIPPIKTISVYYKKVEIFFYESKKNLFEVLLNRYQNKRYALILGSSRSGMFIQSDIQNHLPYPMDTYNFSAPMAGTSFYYYWLYKIKESNIQFPEFILMELDAINLGNPSLYISLPYSFDPLFMLKHMDFYRHIPDRIDSKNLNNYMNLLFSNKSKFKGFSADEVDSYFLKYFFIIARYNIHPLKILENFNKINYWDPENNQTIKIPLYKFSYYMQIKYLEKFKTTLGGIPIEFYTVIPEQNFKEDAEKNFKRFLPTSELSTTQLIFLKKILEFTSKYHIPLIIYKPPMTYFANDILKTKRLYELPSILEFIMKFKNVIYIDTTEIQCNHFSDSVHLSPQCYKVLTQYIFDHIRKRFPVF